MEGAIFCGVGIEGFVGQRLFEWAPLNKEILCRLRKVSINEALPDILHCLVGRVKHVGSIEAIVAELVHHYFIGRKICNGTRRRNGRSSGNNLLNGEEKRGLGQLALVVTVFAIADGANGEDYLNSRVHFTEKSNRLAKVVGTLVNSEFFFLKKSLRPFLAVVNDFSSLLKTVDVVGAKGKKGNTRSRRRSGRSIAGQALDGVENAGGVIHHAKRIDSGREGLLSEALSDSVSKAGPHEEHLFTGFDEKSRFPNSYLCTELHHFTCKNGITTLQSYIFYINYTKKKATDY